MPNLARTNPKQPARSNVPAAKTKILLVRQPVKSVRKSDEPDRAMLQLAYGVVIVLGIIAAVWLMGYLGFRLGFAPAVRVPDLMAEGAGGLAAGAMMLMSLPRTIVEAGIAEPMLLMLGFAMIAVPAGILGAIKPSAPGGKTKNGNCCVINYRRDCSGVERRGCGGVGGLAVAGGLDW